VKTKITTVALDVTLTIPAELPLGLVQQLEDGRIEPWELFDVHFHGKPYGLNAWDVFPDMPLVEVSRAWTPTI
jgi:hypothetical protein